MADRLQELRQEIDRLDDEILTALRSRWRLSGEIIAAKNGQNAFRPGREANVIRRLVTAAPDIQPATILGIWRQIFSASIAQQDTDIVIAVHHDALPAAVWHFGSSMQLQPHTALDQVFAALDDGVRYAMVPCHLGDEIATSLWQRNDRFVVAKTPLYDVSGIAEAYIIGGHMADESDHDSMLYALPSTAGAILKILDRGAVHDDVLASDAKLIGMVAR